MTKKTILSNLIYYYKNYCEPEWKSQPLAPKVYKGVFTGERVHSIIVFAMW